MPSAELIAVLETALDNPAFDIPIETKPLGPPGRPRIVPVERKDVRVPMGLELIDILDRKRGTKSRSQFIRDLIEQA